MEYLKFVQYMFLNYDQDYLYIDCLENTTTRYYGHLSQKIVSANEAACLFKWLQIMNLSFQLHYLQTLY